MPAIERPAPAGRLERPALGLDRIGIAEAVDDDIGARAGQRLLDEMPPGVLP